MLMGEHPVYALPVVLFAALDVEVQMIFVCFVEVRREDVMKQAGAGDVADQVS